MSSHYTVTYANFETVDLAELAARQIKECYPEVHSIAIRYRNVPPINGSTETVINDLPDGTFTAATAAGVGLGNGFGVTPVVIPGAFGVHREGSRYHNMNERHTSTESHLVIKCPDQISQKVEAKLINLGGIAVHSVARSV